MSSISEHRLMTLAGILVERPMDSKTKEPGWADFAGQDTAIRKADFTDPNFFRKYIYQAIGDDRKLPMILWAYDGKKLEHLTLWGNSRLWPEMAKGMSILFPNSKAIFLSAEKKNLVLIAMDGKVRDKPIPISHQSPNGNPANDWDFIGTLPRHLAKIANDDKAGREASVPAGGGDYKAWINVIAKKLVPLPGGQNFRDVLKAKPDAFGTAKAATDVQARDMAERNGWVAGEVVSKDGRTVAVIYAKDDASALRAARLLFADRYKQNPWVSITVRTNYATNTYTGAEKIVDYLRGNKPETKPVHYL